MFEIVSYYFVKIARTHADKRKQLVIYFVIFINYFVSPKIFKGLDSFEILPVTR